ncbi:hypothetical protein [Planktotalea sp.]|uniref:hypothetical protein n=1 Tax=Planktotalea sp. TaxID=2029877 RepID=UPI003F6B6254
MLILSLVVNILVLVPLCFALLTGSATMDAAYGPVSAARSILTAVYLAILVMSIVCLAIFGLKDVQTAVAWALPLLFVQILYKSLTGPMVGLSHPVVQANLAIVALHVVTVFRLVK